MLLQTRIACLPEPLNVCIRHSPHRYFGLQYVIVYLKLFKHILEKFCLNTAYILRISFSTVCHSVINSHCRNMEGKLVLRLTNNWKSIGLEMGDASPLLICKIVFFLSFILKASLLSIECLKWPFWSSSTILISLHSV